MAAISDTTIVIAARDVMAADFSNDVVLLNLRDGVYYGVEEVGARIWTLVQAPIALKTIVETIAAEFDVEPDRCARDVGAFVQQLIGRGLVERVDAR